MDVGDVDQKTGKIMIKHGDEGGAEGAAEPLIRLWCNCDQRLVEGAWRTPRRRAGS